ncbi:MAG: hypothetical protein AABZ30_01155, partial [Myxococcota bacterium]
MHAPILLLVPLAAFAAGAEPLAVAPLELEGGQLIAFSDALRGEVEGAWEVRPIGRVAPDLGPERVAVIATLAGARAILWGRATPAAGGRHGELRLLRLPATL